MKFRWMLFLGLFPVHLFAQCITVTPTQPYTEGFETSNGNWFDGGNASDWTWGTPSKPTISSAASGVNCWIVGGLTGSSYNNGEASWLQSPCFDLSALVNPHVKFKIFWECEHHYDGGNFQYSLDGGSTWTNVGAYGDPVDCLNDNWFNYASINYLAALATPKNGWSGNIQATTGNCQGGFGSNGWVTAQHCMPYLTGASNVLFRFTFGAGTACNAYDGIAIDDIVIEEAPTDTALFTFACNGSAVNFSDQSYPCISSWQWDFGDPVSGANNTSTQQSPAHTFSGANTYTVTLIAGGACGTSGTVTQNITVLPNGVLNQTNVSCHGASNGSATIGGFANTNYAWSNGQTSTTATGLAVGTYTVTVSATNACSQTVSVTITQPPVLSHSITTTAAACGSTNGSATVTESGGTQPYSYSWSGGTTGNTATNLSPGVYVVTITDANNCMDTAHAIISGGGGLSVASSQTNVSCYNGNNGSATVTVNGGATPYVYQWSVPGQTGSALTSLVAGAYTVTVTDVNNCVSTVTINIVQPTALIHTVTTTPSTCGSNTGTAQVNESGGTGAYNYAWSSGTQANGTFNNLSAGTYTITITDASGCTDTAMVHILSLGGVTASIAAQTSVSCFGGNNGTATATFTGGAAPIMYQWTNGQTQATAASLSFGNYGVTITDANGCSGSATVAIVQPAALVTQIISTSAHCNANDGSASASVNGGVAPYMFLWSGVSSTVNAISSLSPGIYSVTVTDSNGCTTADSTTLSTINSNVVPDLGRDTTLCEGSTIILSPGLFTNYLWQDQSTQPTFSVNTPGEYWVHVTDASGCTGTDTITIISGCDDDVFVPNAFSPNGDGLNDEFRAIARNVSTYELSVYNRWGQLMFRTESVSEGWDGTFLNVEQPVGCYAYVIVYSTNDAATSKTKKGNVVLLR